MGVTGVTGQAEAAMNSVTQAAGKSLGKETFLQLMVTQLSHQDPLNPMEDKEFTAQLAQFSSLEQLTSINEGIQNLLTGNERQEMLSATNFIGKEVRAYGESVTKSGDDMTPVYYSLSNTVSNHIINIYDSDGAIVRTLELGAKQAGDYELDWQDIGWDGKDAQGNALPDGVYHFAMMGETPEGQPLMVPTEVTGTVDGVFVENGTHYLRLSDGRSIGFLDVKEVVKQDASAQDQAQG